MPTLREIDEYLTNLSIGLGRGFSTQLQGVLGMIENPVQTAKGLYQVASNPGQIPGMVRNALADAAMRGTSGPMGLGEVVGENIGFRTPKGPTKLDATVYHGSPHDFDRFDMSKIGTGEGAQAYGHGLYVAESKDVAKSYKDVLTKTAPPGEHDGAAYNFVQRFGGDEGYAKEILQQQIEAMGNYSPNIGTARGMLESISSGSYKGYKPPAGALYTVDLPDTAISQMLDWDAPLSQQPELLAKLRKAGYALADDDSLSGAEFYRRLTQELGAEPEDISADLLANGITGIRYLDGNSRTNMFRPTTEGTRNFVVFDDKLLKILNKE